ncbi:hypothetical protein FQB35_15280 [Crassaminicella thermophila]|uniref:Membrane protein YkvI n=1 Tax=Crassaminicella thermophila TaxID=2599308 RepID=A0A5C0SG90_CRATE|nr:hypothetical protein [Crassaminicella thermophila]QEK13513.1 hypothetical protein FQB35_15280 [Crassaminicella thermophila]
MVNKNILKIASIYIGTLVGAGFASGQEIMCFFTKYGIGGVYGVILTAVLFSFIGSFILSNVYKHKVSSYNDWIMSIFGMPIGRIIEFILSLLVLSLYCVMLAGSGALFEEQFGYRKEVGIILMSLITFMTFLFSMRGLTFVNSILVPLLVVGIIAVGIFVISDSHYIIKKVDTTFYTITDNWVLSCLIYVSYNSFGAAMVLSSMYPLLENKRVAIISGIIGGLGLGFMLFFLFLPTLMLYTDIKGVEIPMMTIASKLGENVKLIYGILLWFAMLTTAIANGFVFIQSIEKRFKINHIIICILFCLGTIPLAKFGFKNLVKTIYPLFGYIGIFIIGLILIKGVNRKNFS